MGLERDIKTFKREGKDGVLNDISNLLKDSFDPEFIYNCITYNYVNVDNKDLILFNVKKSYRECFIKNKECYYRTNPASLPLEGKKFIELLQRKKNES